MPDISVLLPTRNRPYLLIQTITQMFVLAQQPESVEILLAVDPDATGDQDLAGLLHCRSGWNVNCWVAPERFGSARMQEYYNHLATIASGTWLMIWNDDATMLTAHWDSIVRANPGLCLWLDHMGTGPEHCNMFPVWPRAWTEAIGHIADGSPRVDTWLQEVAELLGKQVKVPVQVRHISPDDQTWREGREYYLPEFHAMRQAREHEAAILRAHGF